MESDHLEQLIRLLVAKETGNPPEEREISHE
jgi:hypothetical protein